MDCSLWRFGTHYALFLFLLYKLCIKSNYHRPGCNVLAQLLSVSGPAVVSQIAVKELQDSGIHIDYVR